MKMVKYKSVRMFAVAFAMVGAIVGCSSEDPITATVSGPVARAQNTPTVTPQEIRRSDGGTTYLRAEGWPIPSFGEAERKEFELSITTANGRNVKAYRTHIRTDPLSLYIDNPLYLIGIGFERVRLNEVKEYRTSAGVFCYRFQVNDAYADESTNKVVSRGFLYSYSYYDEDGDGVFESLIISEKDRHGRKGFQNEPHIPEWSIAQPKRIVPKE